MEVGVPEKGGTQGPPRTKGHRGGTEGAPRGHRWTKMYQKCETVVRNRAPPLQAHGIHTHLEGTPWALYLTLLEPLS